MASADPCEEPGLKHDSYKCTPTYGQTCISDETLMDRQKSWLSLRLDFNHVSGDDNGLPVGFLLSLTIRTLQMKPSW